MDIDTFRGHPQGYSRLVRRVAELERKVAELEKVIEKAHSALGNAQQEEEDA